MSRTDSDAFVVRTTAAGSALPDAAGGGTAMPANFASDPPQYQEQYPDSTNDQQIRVVLEWLYNFDRIYMSSND